MNKFTLRITRISLVALLAIFMVSGFAQGPKAHLSNINPTVTHSQIVAWGQAGHNVHTSTIVLSFEGLGDLDQISQFYNGGTSGSGYSGTNFGVYFSSNTLALIDQDAGGTGNIANEPSPSTGMFFLDGDAAIMNVTAGFTNGFSFYYSANSVGSVSVYDGLDGTGNVLASLTLPLNYDINCTGDPNGAYCHWDAIGVSFTGTAKSVSFAGVQDYVVFDDVTFGKSTPGFGGINLTQTTASGPVGVSHTVKATVTDNSGAGIAGKLVTFKVLSGPNTGTLGTATTDVNGEASLTYTGTTMGVDDIQACTTPTTNSALICSNELNYEWTVVTNVPTMSQWGLIFLGVILLSVGTVYILRSRNSDIAV